MDYIVAIVNSSGIKLTMQLCATDHKIKIVHSSIREKKLTCGQNILIYIIDHRYLTVDHAMHTYILALLDKVILIQFCEH